MQDEDRRFLRNFFRSISDQALEPDDPRYVRIYDDRQVITHDPVEILTRGIEWTPGGSVQLFSGFRGTGKSTELRRLRERLREGGFLVILCDIEDYINLSTPIDVSDFLVAVSVAVSEAVADDALLGQDPAREGYARRFWNFLTRTRVELDELSLEGGEGIAVGLKASLKQDPSFKQKLQERLAGHLGMLVRDVREYFEGVVVALKHRHGMDREVVLLVDSAEKLRGTSVNAAQVHSSVETLFAGHAEKLRLPGLHTVYAVPPYLKVRYPGLGALYAPGGIQVLPAIKVRDDRSGDPFQPGLAALAEVVSKRGDWARVLGDRATLDRLSLLSGGHLRDLLYILAEILRRATELPVSATTIDAAVDQIRNEFLPLPDEDALWLDRVARTHDAGLTDAARLPDLARYLDTHLLLCYRNGHEWYDVHPLVAAHVRQQAEAVQAERLAAQQANGQAP